MRRLAVVPLTGLLTVALGAWSLGLRRRAQQVRRRRSRISSPSGRWLRTSRSLAPPATASSPRPVKLSDFRGETVVLAFFFRARSGG